MGAGWFTVFLWSRGRFEAPLRLHFFSRLCALLRLILFFYGSAATLMEVAARRASGLELDFRSPELFRNKMDYAVFNLQHPGDSKKTHRLRQYSIALKNTLPNDDIHEAGFILQCHENHPASGAWTLAANYQTHIINSFAVRHSHNRLCIRKSLIRQNPS